MTDTTLRRAWRVTAGDIEAIVATGTRSGARAATSRSAVEAGYVIPFTSIRVLRAPEYDRWAYSKSTNCVYSEDLVKKEQQFLTAQDERRNAMAEQVANAETSKGDE